MASRAIQTNTAGITVVIVDDHPIVRAGMQKVLGAADDILIVAEGGITNANPASLTVTADHTLFHGNATRYGSGVSSAGEVNGNPLFVNPAAFDYHVGPGSAADAGIPILWLVTDIDGDSRPARAGSRPDLGADEVNQRRVYLPVVMRNAP